jgi:zinc protease
MTALPIDRSAPPPAGAVRPFRFPAFLRRRLPCGIEAYVAQLPGVPLLSVELVTPAGAQYDPEGSAGLATLTAALLDEGAAGRSALEIAGAIEGLGGQLGTGADWDVGYIGLLALSRHLGAGLGLIADVMTAPTFPQAEIERLRRQRLTDILRRRHQPSAIADEELTAVVYRGTVYANSPFGSETTVPRFERDDFLAFYRRHYPIQASKLIAVSDLDPETVLAAVTQALEGRGAAAGERAPGQASGETAGTLTAVPQPDIAPAPLPRRQIQIVDRPGASQTELRLGHLGVRRSSPDFSVLTFLNTMLGGKFTSRINLNLRERHGYTYGASTRFAGRLGPGPFVVSAAVATESTGAAAAEVLSELRRIQDEPVSEAEMDETRSYMLGVFPYTVQGINDLAKRLSDLAVYSLPDDHFDRYPQRVGAVTSADIQRAAQRYLLPENLAIVAVGPAEILEPQLAALGDVTVRTATVVDAASPHPG